MQIKYLQWSELKKKLKVFVNYFTDKKSKIKCVW